MPASFWNKKPIKIIALLLTVVLAAVAIFTSIRLYNLRQESIAPTAPTSVPLAKVGPVEIGPKSGHWNFPIAFIVKNTSNKDINLRWLLDCWDETKCSDTMGLEVLSPNETFEKGLGKPNSKWQFDVNWSDTWSEENEIWDWGGIAEISPINELDAFPSEVVTPSPSPTASPSPSPSIIAVASPTATSIANQQSSSSQSASAASSTPTATPTLSPTATPTISPTNSASATATPDQQTAGNQIANSNQVNNVNAKGEAPKLPEAGFELPTYIGIFLAVIAIIGSLAILI